MVREWDIAWLMSVERSRWKHKDQHLSANIVAFISCRSSCSYPYCIDLGFHGWHYVEFCCLSLLVIFCRCILFCSIFDRHPFAASPLLKSSRRKFSRESWPSSLENTVLRSYRYSYSYFCYIHILDCIVNLMFNSDCL